MAEMTRKRLDGIKDNCAAQSFRTLERWEVLDLIAAVEELVAALRETDSLMETVYDGMMPLSVATLGMKNEAILSRYQEADHG